MTSSLAQPNFPENHHFLAASTISPITRWEDEEEEGIIVILSNVQNSILKGNFAAFSLDH